MNAETTQAPAPPVKFGAFLGVFTPSILTILGVIMYLRFGWIVANAGLAGTLLIVIICSAVALITALSASAIATNMALGVGGEYFLISRSLGLPIGGAIGIPLYLCRILSVTLYAFGLAEAFSIAWPAAWGPPPMLLFAAAVILLTGSVAGRSATLALKLQVPMMGLILLSLLALAFGVLTGPTQPLQWTPPPLTDAPALGFWAILAVYFPAITGFNAGIGMSGDLKDPRKSIPRGILTAVAIGTLIYLAIPLLLAVTAKVSPDQLADIQPRSKPVWALIAIGGGLLVFPGMWAAILSSAFGSILAGARVLQALGHDGLAPRFVSRLSPTGQPAIATWISTAIAAAAVLLGGLNAVATVVTIIFLTLYASINLVAAMEGIVRNPSYRPTIRVPWALSLLGAAGNIAIMFLISPIACTIAVALELSAWYYLRRKTLRAGWGSVWAGIWGTIARFALHKLREQPADPSRWRPNVLLFADDIENRLPLARLAAWFNQNCGVLTVCDILTGQPGGDTPRIDTRETRIDEFLRCQGILAFTRVAIAKDFETGVIDITQSEGLGGMRSNTIMFGWPARPERTRPLLHIVRTLYDMGKATILVRTRPTDRTTFRHIDVWWRGKEKCGDLMLLLAHLLTLNPPWSHARITVQTIIDNETDRQPTEHDLAALIESVRIHARFAVIVKPHDKTINDIIRDTSRNSDLVFMGLRVPEPDHIPEHAQAIADTIQDLPTTVLVRSGGPYSGQLI